jgi:phosphinothricin acetyltransferase
MSAARPVQEGDLARIAEIYAHYVERTAITFDTEVPDLAHWRERLATAEQRRHPWMVSVLDGDVIGYAMTGTFRPKGAYDPTVETTIYLDASRVGAGLGTELYAACLAEAARRGFHLGVAGITMPNERSLALHRKLGFEHVGVFREVGHKLGEWRDVSWWQVPLDRYLQRG